MSKITAAVNGYFEMAHFRNLLENKKQLRVHTGNINSWSELKKQSFQNGAEELAECLKLQLKRWQPTAEQLKTWSDRRNTLCLCQSEFCVTCNVMGGQDRSDLRITVKVFLSSFCPEQVNQCLRSICDELNTDNVERLIGEDSMTEEEETKELLERIKPVWLEMEKRVETSLDGLKVLQIGVADFDLAELRALYDWAPNVKPSIDHFNIQSCCTVPPELQKFAKEKDILLLTHNDPKPFVPDKRLGQICTNDLGVKDSCCERWGVGWVGRYVVMIRSRSVLTGKGYVVEFNKGN